MEHIHITMEFNVMGDKDKHQLEIIALTAQPSPKLTLETQHVFQTNVWASTPFFYPMEPAKPVITETLQIQQEEVVSLQEHSMGIIEDTTIQTLRVIAILLPLVLSQLVHQLFQLVHLLNQNHQLMFAKKENIIAQFALLEK